MTEYVMTGATPDEVWPLVRDFHYTGRMPSVSLHYYAVRERGGLFGDYGERIWAAAVAGLPSNKWSEPVIQLTRLVRHPEYKEPMSALIGFMCRNLRRNGKFLAVSYADQQQEHHGGVYQAAGWNYNGQTKVNMAGLVVDGEVIHGRSCVRRWGTRSPNKLRSLLPGKTIEAHYDEGKHLYWKPLNVAGKTRAKRLGLKSLPYPKPDNAACPLDEPAPAGESVAQPHEAAP
mgnify:FL=1